MELRTKLLLLIGLAAAAGGCGGGGGGGSSGGPAIEPVNAAPTADAGEDQYAYEDATVTLPGSGEDRDGTIAAYRWEQISGPSD